jgi:hypothetical protein
MAQSRSKADTDSFGWPADTEDKLGPGDWKAAKAQMHDPFGAESTGQGQASGQYTHGDSQAAQNSEAAQWPTTEENGPLDGSYTAVQQPRSGVLDVYGTVTGGESALTARDRQVIAGLEELHVIDQLERDFHGPSAPQNN